MQRRLSDCAVVQADMRLCCSYGKRDARVFREEGQMMYFLFVLFLCFFVFFVFDVVVRTNTHTKSLYVGQRC